MSDKRCYVKGCERSAAWIAHDDEYGDMDSCAEHAGYDDWEAMQAEWDALLAAARPVDDNPRCNESFIDPEGLHYCKFPKGHDGDHGPVSLPVDHRWDDNPKEKDR